MTLYAPPAFASEDRERALGLIAAHPFATLITSVADALPQISHLPMQVENGVLTGHLARANPHWQFFAQGHTVAVFHGPHAYVSPLAYTQPERMVPTWNYATVHVESRPELLDDDAAVAVLNHLTARFEPRRGNVMDPKRLRELLAGIVAFRMSLDRCTAKFKMSQNRSAQDRAGVIRALRATGHPDDAAVANWMEFDERNR